MARTKITVNKSGKFGISIRHSASRSENVRRNGNGTVIPDVRLPSPVMTDEMRNTIVIDLTMLSDDDKKYANFDTTSDDDTTTDGEDIESESTSRSSVGGYEHDSFIATEDDDSFMSDMNADSDCGCDGCTERMMSEQWNPCVDDMIPGCGCRVSCWKDDDALWLDIYTPRQAKELAKNSLWNRFKIDDDVRAFSKACKSQFAETRRRAYWLSLVDKYSKF